MPSIVQAINDFKFEATPEGVLDFLKKREGVRVKKESGLVPPWTDDKVLSKSKFLNVFREHDKVSKVIYANAPSNMFYEYIYIMRLVNHAVHIPWLMQDGSEWLSSVESVRDKMRHFIDKGDTVCNPGAYQINPRIGFKYGYRNIRDSLINVIPNRMPYVIEALKSTNQIDVATDNANKAFGGFTNFWMFQAAIDIAWIYPSKMDRNSKPYFGSGSKQSIIDEDIMLSYLNENKPIAWREFYPFDVENAICEYRKYCMRKAKGIPFNRQYKAIKPQLKLNV